MNPHKIKGLLCWACCFVMKKLEGGLNFTFGNVHFYFWKLCWRGTADWLTMLQVCAYVKSVSVTFFWLVSREHRQIFRCWYTTRWQAPARKNINQIKLVTVSICSAEIKLPPLPSWMDTHLQEKNLSQK